MLTKSLLLGALAAMSTAVKVVDSDGYLSNYGSADHHDDDHHDDGHHSDDDHHSYRRGTSHHSYHNRHHPSDGYLSRYGNHDDHHDHGSHHSYSDAAVAAHSPHANVPEVHHDDGHNDDHHSYANDGHEVNHHEDHDSHDEHSDDSHHGGSHHTYRQKHSDHGHGKHSNNYSHYDYAYGPSARHVEKHYGAGHAHQGDKEPLEVHVDHVEAPRADYSYTSTTPASTVGPKPVYVPQDLSFIFDDEHHYTPAHDESEYAGDDHHDGHHEGHHAEKRYPYGYNAYNGYSFADPWDQEIGYNPAHQGTSKNRETDTYGWTNGKHGYGDAYGSSFDEATHDYSDSKAYSENDYYNYGPRDSYVRNHYNPNLVKHIYDRTFVDELENQEEEHYEEEHHTEEPRYDVPHYSPAQEPEYIVHPYQGQHYD